MEEVVDRILLSGLGVTSANPEDIERDLIAEAFNKDGNGNVVASENTEEEQECFDKANNVQASSSGQEILYNKLRAVELEIDAVASTVGPVKNVQSTADDTTLQHALATDRLSSLKKTKVNLQKELFDFCKDYSAKGLDDDILRSIVREEKKPRQPLGEVQRLNKYSNKKRKTFSFAEDTDFDAVLDASSAGFVETERDELIRKGILTPFHKVKGFERRLQQQSSSNKKVTVLENEVDDITSASIARVAQSMSEAARSRPTIKLLDEEATPKPEVPTRPFYRLKKPIESRQSTKNCAAIKKRKKKRPLPGNKWRKLSQPEGFQESVGRDKVSVDGQESQEDIVVDDGETVFVTLEGGLKIPKVIFDQLFDYQKVGVQWLWELHCQQAGGIIGDEMGLGKTIQVLSFLGALHFSGMYKPSIIVCPVTLLQQWKREAQKWYPRFDVEILHDSAQILKQGKPCESDHGSKESLNSDIEENLPTKNTKKWDFLINKILRSESGLLMTTYEQVRVLGDKLLEIEWGYAVLDEGHRIRNPNADITLVCKQLQTVHRIIMTGAPIQNKLTELWSLFDFVFPGKLGVLPVFEMEFAVPISVGGYANASPLQVSTAYRCAVVLRDLIMPYLLRRIKADVNAHLPKKTEHVLFCSLTSVQRSTYRAFLASSEVEQIFDGNRNSLYGIDIMRKICNHPDLLERDHSCTDPDYGNIERSGKMKVLDQVLKMWKEQGHRVLLFAQTQQMVDIIESFLSKSEYRYLRMDGSTPPKQRMPLIDEFNDSDDVFVFILTTKVGGLGTNLTGANRVIIFDPDWNPSTDMQARERAWRIGQKRDVIIYRLITRGTIEEKVYHRQIYKHFLTNKILKNPQQKRFFKARDMKELFVLKDDTENCSTETSNIFSQLDEDATLVGTQKNEKGKEKVDEMMDDGHVDGETDVLRSLFNAHGIHSAINHDVIMNANDEGKLRLEEQATQVAQRAAEALRHSRLLRSQEGISVPTWTGKSGSAGAPPSFRRKFGSTLNPYTLDKTKPSSNAGAPSGRALSSAELLSKIRGNHERAAGDGFDHQFDSACGSRTRAKSVPPEVLARQICTFLQQRRGRSSSGSIVGYFKDRVPSNDLPLFKNLLKEIATLQKELNGSYWVLKPEF